MKEIEVSRNKPLTLNSFVKEAFSSQFNRLLSFYILFSPFILIFRKTFVGSDERAYYGLIAETDKSQYLIDKYGLNGYGLIAETDKSQYLIDKLSKGPLFVIRIFDFFSNFITSLFTKLNLFNVIKIDLLTYRLILLFLIVLIIVLTALVSFKLLDRPCVKDTEIILISVAMFISIPTIIGKQIFSTNSILLIPILILIALISLKEDKENTNISNKFLIGILFGVGSFFRYDSIVIAFIFFILINAQDFYLGKLNKYKNFIYIFGFGLITLPSLSTYLFKEGFNLPLIFNSGWDSTVWKDGPFKYLVLCQESPVYLNCLFSFESVKNIILSFVDNVKEYSSKLFSIDAFPSFLILLPLSLFFNKKYLNLQSSFYLICLSYILSSFAYLIFEIEMRYLIFSCTGLGLLSVAALSNRKIYFSYKKTFKVIIFLEIIGYLVYLIFSHKTYPLQINIFN